jgi:hypothetical protein
MLLLLLLLYCVLGGAQLSDGSGVGNGLRQRQRRAVVFSLYLLVAVVVHDSAEPST